VCMCPIFFPSSRLLFFPFSGFFDGGHHRHSALPLMKNGGVRGQVQFPSLFFNGIEKKRFSFCPVILVPFPSLSLLNVLDKAPVQSNCWAAAVRGLFPSFNFFLLQISAGESPHASSSSFTASTRFISSPPRTAFSIC